MRYRTIVPLALLLVFILAACGDSPAPATFQKFKPQQAVDAFKAAKLEAETPRAMTKQDYGLAPFTATEGMRFFIPSIGADNGGRIMSFANQADLDATKAYYVNLGKQSAVFSSWVYQKDNILVQINGSLAEDKAKAYETALNGLK